MSSVDEASRPYPDLLRRGCNPCSFNSESVCSAQPLLPFEAPPFHRITDADYQPGVDQGMAEQIVEMRKIANNPAAPTFDNTNATLERSGALLRRVSAASGAVNQADTNSVRQAV